ncbi:hypothetical protein DY000_02021398 [Brassica cretica]|uniref:Uncharacterized protein n=1 Tax=Brassica cretica TaxID=69181 RepID=A0ABQ7E907_BRACR|nr:hypothetical protein DY000_02021398 [Brassica cretica]
MAELDRPRDQLVHPPSWTSLVRRMAELDRTRDQLGHPPSWNSPVRWMAELGRTRDQLGHPPSWTNPVRRVAELGRSCCHSPVLVAPSFGIGSNMLLFHLDQGHRQNFTI